MAMSPHHPSSKRKNRPYGNACWKPASKSRDCCLCVIGLLFFPGRLPSDPLEVEHKNGVKDRDKEQGDESSDGKPADLGIAERFPERAAFERERKQSEDRRAHGDHHRANTLNPSIRKSALERLPLFVHLLDEIEQHNHMADDDAD